MGWLCNSCGTKYYDKKEAEECYKECRKRKRRIIHKYITKPRPTKTQPDAVSIHYLCNQAFYANWKKTDITPMRINCKNCKKIMKGEQYEG